MEHPHEPIDVIQGWQDWYKKNRMIAQMDEPLVSKDSRENLHDSSNAVDTLPDWRTFYAELLEDTPKPMTTSTANQKATEYFADTIAEFAEELSGTDLYKAFYTAAYKNMESLKKDYDKARELVDMLRYQNFNQ